MHINTLNNHLMILLNGPNNRDFDLRKKSYEHWINKKGRKFLLILKLKIFFLIKIIKIIIFFILCQYINISNKFTFILFIIN